MHARLVPGHVRLMKKEDAMIARRTLTVDRAMSLCTDAAFGNMRR